MTRNHTSILAIVAVTVLNTHATIAGEVTLTPSDVTSAAEIEAAIAAATNGGTGPGTVILEGGDGPFTYTGADRTIDISASDLVLTGTLFARFPDCETGIRFDRDVEVRNVTIENLSFDCSGTVIVSSAAFAAGPDEEVVVRNNILKSSGGGISLNRTRDWEITSNVIVAGSDREHAAVALQGGRGARVIDNILIAGTGVVVEIASDESAAVDHRIKGNRMEVTHSGVILDGDAVLQHRVDGNAICIFVSPPTDTPAAGIFLGIDTNDNRVRWNRVGLEGNPPLPVTIVEDVGMDNVLIDNRERRC